MPPRTPLKVGYSAVTRLVTVVIALAVAGFAAFVALIAYGFAYGARESVNSSINDGIYHRDENGRLVPGPSDADLDTAGIVGGIAGGICALVFLILAIYLALRVLRSAAWLSGTVLTIRSAVRKRSADLAKARVTSKKQPNVLIADKITLRLKPLSEDQLLMIANAISNTRVRSGPEDEAFVTADRLRALARDPFA